MISPLAKLQPALLPRLCLGLEMNITIFSPTKQGKGLGIGMRGNVSDLHTGFWFEKSESPHIQPGSAPALSLRCLDRH